MTDSGQLIITVSALIQGITLLCSLGCVRVRSNYPTTIKFSAVVNQIKSEGQVPVSYFVLEYFFFSEGNLMDVICSCSLNSGNNQASLKINNYIFNCYKEKLTPQE